MYYVGLCLSAVGTYYNDTLIHLSTVLFGVQFLFVGMGLGVWVIRRRGSYSALGNPATFAVFNS
jgi:hypothetical protein